MLIFSELFQVLVYVVLKRAPDAVTLEKLLGITEL